MSSRRHGQWDLVGYPSDPVPATSADVARVARFYDQRADEVDEVQRALFQRSGRGNWTGSARDQFNYNAVQTRSSLARAGSEYRGAATSVRTYGHAVDVARDRTHRALVKAEIAEANRKQYAQGPPYLRGTTPIGRIVDPLAHLAEQARYARLEAQAESDLYAATMDARGAVDDLAHAATTLREDLLGGTLARWLGNMGFLPQQGMFQSVMWALGLPLSALESISGYLQRTRYGFIRNKLYKLSYGKGRGFWASTKNMYKYATRDGVLKARAGQAGNFAKYGRFARFAKWGGGAVTAVAAGVGQWQDDSKNPRYGAGEKVARAGAVAGGAVAGAIGGAQLGATIGMAGGPVGVAVGGFVGGAVGAAVGSGIAKGAVNAVSGGVRKLKFW